MGTQRPKLFGTSGLRGVYGSGWINTGGYYNLGVAISEFVSEGSTVAVGRDIRTSSTSLLSALVSGLLSGGMHVEDIGICTTPVLANITASNQFDIGAMVTASHNPPEFNGLKLFGGNGAGLSREDEARLEEIAFQRRRKMAGKYGKYSVYSTAIDEYVKRLLEKFPEKHEETPLLVDCGYGAVSLIAPEIYPKKLSKSRTINAVPDGYFSFRNPEPNNQNLSKLSEIVRKRGDSIGFAFDGDGDRLAVLDRKGEVIETDHIMAILVKEILNERKGKVVISVNMSRTMYEAILRAGGEPVYAALGKTYRDMLAMGGVAAAEPWKFIDPSWGLWEDGVYASLMLLRVIEREGGIEKALEEIPRYYKFEVFEKCPDQSKGAVYREVSERIFSKMPGSKIIEIDGLRCEQPDGSWVLVRPSGTEPKFRAYGEAPNKKMMQKLKENITHIIRDAINRQSDTT